MDQFKLCVDILSSLASFIAIATVLISWFKNSQKALKIDHVVVHSKKAESIFILVIENRKPYPVTIKTISAFLKSNILVEKCKNLPPIYKNTLSATDLVFMSSQSFEIPANGYTEIRIHTEAKAMKYSSLTFSIHTSHGYHQLDCNQIQNIEMQGESKVFAVEYTKGFSSRLKAWCKYQSLKLIYLFKKS